MKRSSLLQSSPTAAQSPIKKHCMPPSNTISCSATLTTRNDLPRSTASSPSASHSPADALTLLDRLNASLPRLLFAEVLDTLKTLTSHSIDDRTVACRLHTLLCGYPALGHELDLWLTRSLSVDNDTEHKVERRLQSVAPTGDGDQFCHLTTAVPVAMVSASMSSLSSSTSSASSSSWHSSSASGFVSATPSSRSRPLSSPTSAQASLLRCAEASLVPSTYLLAVRQRLNYRPVEFDEFQRCLQEYQATSNRVVLLHHVQRLLAGNDDLMQELLAFLPQEASAPQREQETAASGCFSSSVSASPHYAATPARTYAAPCANSVPATLPSNPSIAQSACRPTCLATVHGAEIVDLTMDSENDDDHHEQKEAAVPVPATAQRPGSARFDHMRGSSLLYRRRRAMAVETQQSKAVRRDRHQEGEENHDEEEEEEKEGVHTPSSPPILRWPTAYERLRPGCSLRRCYLSPSGVPPPRCESCSSSPRSPLPHSPPRYRPSSPPQLSSAVYTPDSEGWTPSLQPASPEPPSHNTTASGCAHAPSLGLRLTSTVLNPPDSNADTLLQRPRPPSSTVSERQGVCDICMDARTSLRLSRDRRCRHLCCADCASLLLGSILKAGRFPARCCCCISEQPSSADVGYICDATVQAFVDAGLDRDVQRRFDKAQVMGALHPSLVTTCPSCHQSAELFRANITRVQCPHCPLVYCHQCNRVWHSDQPCVMTVPAPDAESARMLDRTSKPCPRCHTRTTHFRGHGCHHIRGCPTKLSDNTVCAQHWCYACGRAYQGRIKQCDCSIFCNDTCGCPPCAIRATEGSCNCADA